MLKLILLSPLYLPLALILFLVCGIILWKAGKWYRVVSILDFFGVTIILLNYIL